MSLAAGKELKKMEKLLQYYFVLVVVVVFFLMAMNSTRVTDIFKLEKFFLKNY